MQAYTENENLCPSVKFFENTLALVLLGGTLSQSTVQGPDVGHQSTMYPQLAAGLADQDRSKPPLLPMIREVFTLCPAENEDSLKLRFDINVLLK